MSRLKVAAQLIQDQEYKTALDMLKRDESSQESFYWRSLICRLMDWYDEEKKIIDMGSQKYRDFDYMQERSAWHKKPLFERMVPRQPVVMPKDPLEVPLQSTVEQTCFVTGGDSNYFTLIVECIESIRNTQTYKDCAVCVLDCGLKTEEKQYLTEKLNVHDIKDPGWFTNSETFYRYSPSRDQVFSSPLQQNPGNKSIAARAIMDHVFPGFRYYMWIDADAWVQDERAIDMMLSTCQTQYCAGAIHCNGSIGKTGFLKSQLFDEEKKNLIASRPTITGGVCCFDAQSGFMEEWAQLMRDSIKKYGYWYTQDECAMNYLFYKYNFDKILPYECNYRFSPGLPIVVGDDPVLRNPHNHQVIGIIHLPSSQKQKFHVNTHNILSPLSHEDIQKHAQYSNQVLRDPNLMCDSTRFNISIRFRVYPWQDKTEIKHMLNKEIQNA